ncbi:MAG: LCP family protein [Firmicutes bacterium]|nr:LCP family protein [Bacillota bacterium]
MARRGKALLLAVFFIVMTVASTCFFGYTTGRTTGEEEEMVLPTDGKLHVLLVGVDDGLVAPGQKSRGRSDTLMVASFDPKTGEGSLLSIPRDTRVSIPGRKYKEKINHAYAYGGIDLTLNTVRQFLGIPLRYYIQIDTSGFRKLVDAIGGVPIEVEKDMKYTDRAGGLYINLKQGYQVLNGEQAEGYVRYRWSDSDYARTQRQQKFIKAAIKQILKPANLLKINQLYRIATETVNTNIPLSVGIRYLPAIKSLQEDKITTYTLEGEDAWINGTYYYEPDLAKLEELIENHFYSQVNLNANGETGVEICVANGDRDNGEQIAQLLQKHGFRIVGITVSEDGAGQPISQVVSTRKESEKAVAVAELLSVHEVLLDVQQDATADVIVVVGKDMLP